MSRGHSRRRRGGVSAVGAGDVGTARRSRSLARALGIASRGAHAFVGAGGKTACIARLLRECPSAVATTTTHLGPTGMGTGLLAVFPSAAALEVGCEWLWPARPLTLAVQAGTRLRGPEAAWLERLPRKHPDFLLFVEADGAARRLLKLPASHEPVWPPLPLRRVVIVIGMAAWGRPLEDVAHHPERFGRARRAGMPQVERMLRAYVDSAPATAPLTVLCTGVDPTQHETLQRLFRRCLRWVRRRRAPFQDPGVSLRLVAAENLEASPFTVWHAPAQRARGVARFPGVWGVLLAAGLGERYRQGTGTTRSKLLVSWRRRPLVEHAAECFAQAGFTGLLAVTGHAAPEVEKVLRRVARRHAVPLRIVRNGNPRRGLGSSVRLAARGAPAGMALVFGHGDMPALRRATLRRIAATGSALRRCIVVPEIRGKPANPVFFPADLREELQRVPDAEGGRAVIRAHPERLFRLAWTGGEEFHDVDVPADWQWLRRGAAAPANFPVLCLGGGDLGTGVIHVLARAGFPVAVVELTRPQAVRRLVAFAEAARGGETRVEGQLCRRVELSWLAARWMPRPGAARGTAKSGLNAEVPVSLGFVPLVVEPWRQALQSLQPAVLVDARLAKAPLRGSVPPGAFHVALGPGHTAGADCDAVVETLRGADLGRVIWRGRAAPNTGIPGEIGGMTAERVLRAPRAGVLQAVAPIGARLRAGQVVARVGGSEVRTCIAGVLRGMLAPGDRVRRGQKLGDVDPRHRGPALRRISDKSQRVGEGVLEAICLRFGISPPLRGKK